MNVGIEALHIGEKSGVGRSIFHFCKALVAHPDFERTYHILVDSTFDASVLGSAPHIRVYPINLMSSKVIRTVWENIFLANWIKKTGIDIMHFTCYLAPHLCPVPYCLSVYDIIAIKAPSLARPINRWHYQLRLPRSIIEAAMVVAPSQYVARDILGRWPCTLGKIFVIPLAPDPVLLKKTARQKNLDDYLDFQLKAYFLMIGNLEPKKNHFNTILAFLKVAERHPGLKLVLIGREYWGYSKVSRLIKNNPNSIIYRSVINSTALSVLYKNAIALLSPSVEEGYGLPPLEAALFGKTIIGSCVHSQEALPSMDYRQINPGSLAEIEREMEKVLRDKPGWKIAKRSKGVPTWKKYIYDIRRKYSEIIGR